MEVAGGGGLVINITGNTFGAGTSQAQVKALFTAAVNEMKLKGLTK